MRGRFATVGTPLLDALAGYEPSMLSGEEAARDAESLAQVAKVCQIAALRAAARAAECRAHRGSAGEWVAKLTGSSPGAGRRQLEATVAAEGNPVVKEALVEGRISAEQAAVVLDGAEVDPGAVEGLVQTAEERGLRGVREETRKIRLHREDPQVLHERQHRLTEFSHWVDDDGMVAGKFRLPPEIGAAIVTRLESEADRIYRAAPKQQRHQRPHGAFLADAFVATIHGEAKGGKGRTDLVLVVDYDRWLGLNDDGRCHIPGVGPVPLDFAHRMAGDAFLKGVVVDGTQITTVRHYGRHIPAEVRTVLDLGDLPELDGRNCRICGRRLGLETDHTHPLTAGGPTAHDNLNDLCRPCHRDKTERDRAAGLLRKHGAP